MTPYSMWTKEALIKELQQKQEYIADKECQIFVLVKTNNEFAKDLQETIDMAAEIIKDYQIMETETLKQLHIICNQIIEANKLFERYLYLKNESDPQTYKEVDIEESEMEAIEESLQIIFASNLTQEKVKQE
jgi:hypothetical protein